MSRQDEAAPWLVGYCTQIIRALEAELNARAAVWAAVVTALEDGARRHSGDPDGS